MSTPFVLILSNPQDYHAFVVSECLHRKGVSHSLWYAADFPSLQRASAWFGGPEDAWAINGPEISLVSRVRPSTVWLRRPSKPVIPDDIDSSDRLFAYRECWTFLDGFRRLLGNEAFWVNPPVGFARANLKIEQLQTATKSGLRIPETLMSNDPAEIRSFVEARAGRVVYKAFFPFSWRSDEGLATLFCTPISSEDLVEDSALAAAPGIYQALVEKAYEVRVTVIGQHFFAVKIHSQEIASALMDWRAAIEPVRLERLALPEPITMACRAVMEDLGIVFGCFDFVVTPAGDYVFLEVNEMGAFLWLEERLPELCLVDTFCELLCQGRPDFSISPNRPVVRLADVHASALHRMKAASAAHVHEPEEIPDERTSADRS